VGRSIPSAWAILRAAKLGLEWGLQRPEHQLRAASEIEVDFLRPGLIRDARCDKQRAGSVKASERGVIGDLEREYRDASAQLSLVAVAKKSNERPLDRHKGASGGTHVPPPSGVRARRGRAWTGSGRSSSSSPAVTPRPRQSLSAVERRGSERSPLR
jgi:hypothetical protein